MNPWYVSSGMSPQHLESSPVPLEPSYLTKGLGMSQTLDHLEVTPQPQWQSGGPGKLVQPTAKRSCVDLF